jgi:hypothetical protein
MVRSPLKLKSKFPAKEGAGAGVGVGVGVGVCVDDGVIAEYISIAEQGRKHATIKTIKEIFNAFFISVLLGNRHPGKQAYLSHYCLFDL